ncbi:hypothetical protein [Maritimibacter sp. UBA3975]|uniref:GFA family protein n=1 Tax=Maritimibacter sp. UBA3975 TaxID=1946833 RepID=UPI000C0B9AA0|nr:hypothetical protein [Maritimibacter sp. UBA3975]MAM61883.1 hypothetical protein [Maritimibacter sp.]|tara:strand:- start:2726 stop:3235 length:510 start_codon:yes stop_codon:yes gene_type:complete
MDDATCTCGTVKIALQGDPIMRVECGCTSCQTAGAAFGGVLTQWNTTGYALVRKDRALLDTGKGHLRAHRLTPDSGTRRVVATCCGAPMYLEFEKGHWLSIYAARLPEAARGPVACRTMTKDLPESVVLPQDVPNPKTHTPGFMLKLLGAWVAMGFRTPNIDWAQEAAG